MPWTLYRYILRELLKLLVLTTVVLVTVISFAAAIKPMSEGLLGPAALAKFVGYSAPTMLAFALPFAGAFAATLVFLRMASDNEIVACSASGLSYFSILLPVIGLGLALTMGMFYLSNFVIPTFYRAAAQTVETDLMTVLVSELNQNRPFTRLEDTVLYADTAVQRDPPVLEDAPLQPSKLIELTGVAVGQLDEQGRLRSDTTAQRANVLLFYGETQSWVTIRLRNVMYYDPAEGGLGFTELLDLPPVRLPSPFQDSPKFMSWPQLRELRNHPDRYHEVRIYKRELAQALAAERLRQELRGTLMHSERRQVTLAGARPNDRYTISAPVARVVDGTFALEGRDEEPVMIAYRSPNLPDRRYEAASASLQVVPGEAEIEPSVRVALHQVRVYDARLPAQFSERPELELPRMVWPRTLLPEDYEALSTNEVFVLADQALAAASNGRRAPALARAARLLSDQITDLARKVFAQLHERAASAVACLLLLVLGAVLSLHLKGQMPLVVYFWSFLMAILTIILIHTGENMAGGSRFPMFMGLGVLWSGNVGLAVVAGWVYCRMART